MSEIDDLLERARALPPMTDEQRREQRINFAWGNLACSTNHRVARELVERAHDRAHPAWLCPTCVAVAPEFCSDEHERAGR